MHHHRKQRLHKESMNQRLTDEHDELKKQNEELARENSLLKVKMSNLEARLAKAKHDIRLEGRSDSARDTHNRAQMKTCEQQVKDLSEGLVEHGDVARVKEVHERAHKQSKQLQSDLKKAQAATVSNTTTTSSKK